MLLEARAVAYLNCDSGVVYNQVIRPGASPLMFQLMYDTAKKVCIIFHGMFLTRLTQLLKLFMV